MSKNRTRSRRKRKQPSVVGGARASALRIMEAEDNSDDALMPSPKKRREYESKQTMDSCSSSRAVGAVDKGEVDGGEDDIPCDFADLFPNSMSAPVRGPRGGRGRGRRLRMEGSDDDDEDDAHLNVDARGKPRSSLSQRQQCKKAAQYLNSK